jgi:hypothetical protein
VWLIGGVQVRWRLIILKERISTVNRAKKKLSDQLRA